MSNPSSDSKVTASAVKMIADAKKYVQRHCNAGRYTVVFTSGATESNCLIVMSCAESYMKLKKAKPHIITSSVEHNSVIKCCRKLVARGHADVTFIEPLSTGVISPELVKKIEALIESDAGARLLRSGHPRTTLERLFLRETCTDEGDGGSGKEKKGGAA